MSSMTKVFNTTNAGSVALKQFRLENVDLEVCGNLVAPGSSVEVSTKDWERQARSYARLLNLGALSLAAPTAPTAPTAPAPGLVTLDTGWKKKKKDEAPPGE